MKNKILSVIGIIWGAGIILSSFLSDPSEGNSASKAGEFTALIFGFILLGVSIYNFRRVPKEKK